MVQPHRARKLEEVSHRHTVWEQDVGLAEEYPGTQEHPYPTLLLGPTQLQPSPDHKVCMYSRLTRFVQLTVQSLKTAACKT